MISHLHLIYQFLVVGVGSAALAITIQRARRSGREDHRAFSLFWGIFTGWMAVKLVKNYVFLNVDALEPAVGLFLHALNTDFGFLIVAAVLRYLHVAGEIKGRKTRDVAVLVGLLLSLILRAPPWGVRFESDSWTIEFRFGYWLGSGFYLLGLAYAVILSWIYVARRPRREDRSFLIALALFSTSGIVESLVSFAVIAVDPVFVMGSQETTFSTLPYLIYGLFLILHRGLTGSTVSVKAAGPAELLDEAATRWKLSDREREVAALVLAGLSNKEIAGKLFISTATVKTHVYRISRKTGVDNRFGLIRALRDLVNALEASDETRPPKAESVGQEPGPQTKTWTHRYNPSGPEPPEYGLYDQIWVSPSLADSFFHPMIDRRRNHGGDGSDHDPAWFELRF